MIKTRTFFILYLLFCNSLFSQKIKICYIADFKVTNICENKKIISLNDILKSKKIFLEIKSSINSGENKFENIKCDKVKNTIDVFSEKNICCKVASENRIKNYLNQNINSENVLFYDSKKENYINYQNISVKSIPFSNEVDLNEKIKFFIKNNKKKNVSILIHDASTEYECFPTIKFETDKIISSVDKNLTLTPEVNVLGGNYIWNNGSNESQLNIKPIKNTSYSVKYDINGCISEEAKINVLLSDCTDKLNIRFDLKNKIMYDFYDGYYFIHPPNESLDKGFISKRLESDPNSYLIIDSLCKVFSIKIEIFNLENTLIKSDIQNIEDLSKSRDMPKIDGKIVLKIPVDFFNDASSTKNFDLKYATNYKLKLTALTNNNIKLNESSFYFVKFIKCPYEE